MLSELTYMTHLIYMTYLSILTYLSCFYVSLQLYQPYMWHQLGKSILKYRLPLLIALLAITGFMAYRASLVELSYDFSRAIPTNNPKYKAYQEFKQKFGEDGNLLVLGIQTDKFFEEKLFNEYTNLQRKLKKEY